MGVTTGLTACQLITTILMSDECGYIGITQKISNFTEKLG